MLKMIASDMDGTLLNNDLEITQENIAAIKAAQEKGVHFIVATGRSHTEARPVLEAAGISCPMITVNGAQAFAEDGTNLFTIDFSDPLAKELITTLNDRGLYFEIATTKGFFTQDQKKREKNYSRILHHHHPELSAAELTAMAPTYLEHFPAQIIDDFQKLIANKELAILKFIIFGYEDLAYLTETAEALAQNQELAITSSFKGNIEITHSQAQKGIALTKYAASLNIPLTQTMALGDNLNDLSMLSQVGYSVAMANAEPEVKALATYETDLNDNSGVAKAILRFLP